MSVNRGVARRRKLEKANTGDGAAANFIRRCFTHRTHLDHQPKRNARQRVIAVKNHMLRVNVGHGVELLFGQIRLAACRQRMAIKGHALFKQVGKQRSGLQKNQLFVVFAKTLFWLDLQVHRASCAAALQGGINHVKKIITANEKLDRVVQLVKRFTQCVCKCPAQSRDALLINFHTRIVPPRNATHESIVLPTRHPYLENPMDIAQTLPLLGGISPSQFMKRHWQKKPLLVRQAIPGFQPLLSRSELFDLAASEDAQTRMVIQHAGKKPGWSFKQGPFQRKALPPLKQPGWTILVQGVDLHVQAVHELMNLFRFVPDARLDDLMISFATEGGGVGPHFDSYDVFLLQAHGQRRWRIGRQKDLSLQPDVPLKILSNFVPEFEYVLDPGDMLYLPPGYAHDGVAVGECMTYSVGFRIPNKAELARELLQRVAEDAEEEVGVALYRDPGQAAVDHPAEIPSAMLRFAQQAVSDALNDPLALARGLGEYMTEPKPNVWFEATQMEEGMRAGKGVQLDRRTRMMFDEAHIFINGESFRASGRDALLMRALANQRFLPAKDLKKISKQASLLVQTWIEDGWLHSI